ncbi:hypothetical protein [Mesorhizobium sp. L-8-3]|uniref:hypothetical protein n=1 Tax=Mesorhizobium sp. L-8-3 TaxID=2744522 RepID=UPI001926DCFE|nr:hypothetical protein [Mesorhizobium sp. L-8-3]
MIRLQRLGNVGDLIDVAHLQVATMEASSAQFSAPTSCAANSAFFLVRATA